MQMRYGLQWGGALLLAAALAVGLNGCAGAPPSNYYSSRRDLLGQPVSGKGATNKTPTPAPEPEKAATP